MVVVAIVAVLAALAGTNLGPIIERWRVRQAVEDMTSTYAYARSEAIKRGGNITVRKTALTTALCPQGSGGNDWSCGWTVFDDTNGNGVLDAGEDTLRTTPALATVRVVAEGNQGSVFQLTRWGELQNTTALGFVVTPARTGSTTTTALCMTVGGRVRAKPGATSCS